MSAHSPDSRKAFFSEQRSFISNLEKHHASLGTLYRNIPVLPINVSLYSLYYFVRRLGGFNEVSKGKQWANIAKQLGYPPKTIPRVAHLLCYQYSQLLYSFEISHANSARNLRPNTQLPNIVIPALYESPLDEEICLTRLRCSLTSGFPNEVEVAISSLVILSSRKQLKLKYERILLDLLLAHVGFFQGGEVLDLFQSSGFAGRHHVDRVWSQLLTADTYTRCILHTPPPSPDTPPPPEYSELLAPPCVPEKDSYIYRLYSVATILYNASYIEENCSVILEHSQSVRFLLACLKCSNVILQHFAWDAISVIAEQVSLCSSELEREELVEVLVESLYSKDRFVILRDLEVIRGIASLSDISLPQELPIQVLKLLTLNDVQVILRGIETLYQLTDCSTYTCSHIASTPYGIEILIACLTRELDSLACNTSDKFAMVREVNRVEEQNKGVPEHIHYSITSLYDDTNRNPTASSSPLKGSGEGQGFGPDEMAKKWLQACFEACSKGTVSKTQLYSGYHNYLKNIFQMQSSLGFMRLLEHIRHFFPRASLKKSIGLEGKSSFVFHNLRMKQHMSTEDISHPSVIANTPSQALATSKQKLTHLTKISPQPPQFNHFQHNHRLMPPKSHNTAEMVRQNVVMRNIFSDFAPNRGPLSPPQHKSPPIPPPNNFKLPSPPLPDPIPLKQTPTPPEKESDTMILQIPIEIYNKNSTVCSPKSESSENLVNGFNHDSTQDSAALQEEPNLYNPKKRPQPPSSPTYDQSPKKIPPDSPTHLFTSPKYSPLANNNNNTGNTIVENGYDSTPQLPNGDMRDNEIELANASEDNEEVRAVGDITEPSLAMNADVEQLVTEIKPDRIVYTEFPMVSISLLLPTAENEPMPETPILTPSADPSPKPPSLPPSCPPSPPSLASPASPPTPPTPAVSNPPDTPNMEEKDPLVTKKAKKLSRDKPISATPTCQWHDCTKSFDTWVDLLNHACREHAQVEYPTICLWLGCKTHRNTRSRPSLMRHFQVCHCTLNPIHSKVVSVSNLLDQLKHIPPMEKHFEGTLSRSLHLTTALILRNIAKFCPESINNFILHEDTLLSVATADSQAAPYIAELLSLLSSYQSQQS